MYLNDDPYRQVTITVDCPNSVAEVLERCTHLHMKAIQISQHREAPFYSPVITTIMTLDLIGAYNAQFTNPIQPIYEIGSPAKEIPMDDAQSASTSIL